MDFFLGTQLFFVAFLSMTMFTHFQLYSFTGTASNIVTYIARYGTSREATFNLLNFLMLNPDYFILLQRKCGSFCVDDCCKHPLCSGL